MNALLIAVGFLWLLSRGSSEQPLTGYATRKSKWFAPYDSEGKATMPGNAKGKSGVYFIKQISSGNVVYIGSSGKQLKSTLYRHFQQWQPASWSGHGNVYYPDWENYKVRVIECAPGQALRLEKYFIRKLQPRDCENKYANLEEPEVKELEKAAELLEVNSEPIPWD